MSLERPDLPHVYTEGDTVPSLVVAFPQDISAFTAIVAAVERADGTAFERAGTIINDNQARFDWLATDWIDGCSILAVRLEDAAGDPSHTQPINVIVNPKPTAPTP